MTRPNGNWFQGVRKVRLWLSLDALLRAYDGDGDGALQACRGVLNTAHANGCEPGEQGLVWCKQFHPTAMVLLEHVLAQTQPSDEALAAMQTALEWETTLELRQALRGVRAHGWDRIEKLLAGDTAHQWIAMNRSSVRGYVSQYVQVASVGDAIDFLRGMNRLLAAAEQPLDGRHDQLMQLIQSWEDARPLFRPLVRYGEEAVSEHYWSQAFLRSAIVGVAAERYRIKNGSWPPSPAAIAKEGYLSSVPIDPYDGQPLRWDEKGDGIAICSVRFGSFRLWSPSARGRPPLSQ